MAAETMLAAVYHGARNLRVEQVPAPVPRVDELLLSVHAAGVCGTDVAEWEHGPRVYASPCGAPHPITGHRGPLRLRAGERAVVVGAGGIGAFAVAAAAGLGASVVAVDLDPARLDVARRLGAAMAIAPQEIGDVLGDEPVDLIVEATGSAAAWETIAAKAPVGCRVVIAGLQERPQPIDLRVLSRREQELIGTNAHQGEVDLSRALELLRARREGWGDVAPVAVPLSEIVPQALLPLAERRAAAIKTLVDPWASAARPTSTVPRGA